MKQDDHTPIKQDKDSSRQPLPSLTGGVGGGSFGGDDIDAVILGGITFRGSSKGSRRNDNDRVKTKAKKKGYITGAHGSASARKKADIRNARANRHRGK